MAKTDEPNKIIYSMIGVSKSFDRKVILKDIYLSYFYGAKIGVLGLNGSGKSTLLRILAGVDKNHEGRCVLQPGYTIGYLEQEPLVDEGRTVREVVQEGLKSTYDLVNQFNAISDKLAEPMDDDAMNKLLEKQGELQEKIDHLGAWDVDHQLDMAMDALRCPPDDQTCKTLSGGERRRVALCRLLLQKPDILILDEPTNHLDAESVEWLEQHLRRYEGTVIAVTHDRYFLDKIVDHLFVFEGDGAIRDFPGNYTQYKLWSDERKRGEMMKKRLAVRKPEPLRVSAVAPGKLSFREKRELETLEQEITALEAEKNTIETGLQSGSLSAAELKQQSERWAALIPEIEQKTGRWMALSEREETL